METDNERDSVCEESHIEGMYPVYVHMCAFKHVLMCLRQTIVVCVCEKLFV